MEVIGAIASFIAIGQAIGATPRIISTLKSFTYAGKELAALIDELERLYVLYQHLKENVDLFSGDHNPSQLRLHEPPYLKLIRTDLESSMEKYSSTYRLVFPKETDILPMNPALCHRPKKLTPPRDRNHLNREP
ncbi:hypothetical protein E0Z10_g10918 [Xylaria hypoxylon]|uniref:Fungal N-terminal domain-containing protein n=1 Tax=Xylaria hypoxylon TaxID=37992 RepID=A0A4Z0XXK1_9PEZI|nr:hypothetical protein E0Z10_g10918 [Xylaria hypoxylon]